MWKLLVVAMSVLALYACEDKTEPAQEKPELDITPYDSVSTSRDVTIGSPTLNPGDTSGNEDKYLDDINKKIKEIESNELVKVLPASLPGAESIPPDIGSVADGDQLFVVVSASYKYPQGSITIDLTDYKSARFIPAEVRSALQHMPPVGKGVILGKIDQKEYWGFNYYNERMKTGDIRLIVAARFYVRIAYDNVPQAYTDVMNIINLLKINKMMKYK